MRTLIEALSCGNRIPDHQSLATRGCTETLSVNGRISAFPDLSACVAREMQHDLLPINPTTTPPRKKRKTDGGGLFAEPLDSQPKYRTNTFYLGFGNRLEPRVSSPIFRFRRVEMQMQATESGESRKVSFFLPQVSSFPQVMPCCQWPMARVRIPIETLSKLVSSFSLAALTFVDLSSSTLLLANKTCAKRRLL